MAGRSHGMRTYVLRRLMLMLPTLLGVLLCTFTLCQFVPGGPIDQMRLALAGGASAGGEAGAGGNRSSAQVTLTDAQMETLNAYYGFNLPAHQRFVKYVGNVAKLDLGDSYRYNKPVLTMIKDRLPISLFYGLTSFFLTYAVCVPLGILKALKHRTVVDNGTSVLIFLGYAIPGYALGAVLLTLFAVQRDWFPLAGFKGDDFDTLGAFGKVKNILWHGFLPMVCYMVGSFAVTTMMMKNSLMENMSADYIKTALAKGLNWRRAVFVHALRNSLIPLATSFGNNISLLLAGSLLIERVFTIPGMGMLSYEGIVTRDYPLVMGMVLVGAFLSLVGNLLSDLCVAGVDPRVRFG